MSATQIVEKPKSRALPNVGEVPGGYRIGRGGMGAVYAAEHLESGRCQNDHPPFTRRRSESAPRRPRAACC
ncbi:MAG: hypothetical protein U1F71_14340 [Verrucomicrobiaceae bacterium]